MAITKNNWKNLIKSCNILLIIHMYYFQLHFLLFLKITDLFQIDKTFQIPGEISEDFWKGKNFALHKNTFQTEAFQNNFPSTINEPMEGTKIFGT